MIMWHRRKRAERIMAVVRSIGGAVGAVLGMLSSIMAAAMPKAEQGIIPDPRLAHLFKGGETTIVVKHRPRVYLAPFVDGEDLKQAIQKRRLRLVGDEEE